MKGDGALARKLKSYAQLIRIRHWFKNVILFIPALYGRVLTEPLVLLRLVTGFFAFSLCASAVYTLNDLCDIEKDRQHPVKCKRPLASGAVSKQEGIVLLAVCAAASLVLDVLLCGLTPGALILPLYLFLNVMYSRSWKNKPVVDLVILVSGFVLRMVYGSVITGVTISSWLYLTLIALSLFMAFGKRRGEKRSCGENTRSVLAQYTETYLNSSMYMYLAIFLVFYALWSVDAGVIWTTPLVIVMVMRYTFALEQDDHGDPINMILGDKLLLLLGALYAAVIVVQLYYPSLLPQ